MPSPSSFMTPIRTLAALIFLGALPTRADLTWKVETYPSEVKAKVVKREDGNSYTSLDLTKGVSAEIRGLPDLPCKTISLSIPYDMEVESILSTVRGRHDLALEKPPRPSDCSTPEALRTFGTKKYSERAVWPERTARLVTDGFLDGDKHIVTFNVCPWEYEPGKKKLTLLTAVDVNLKLRKATVQRWLHRADRPENGPSLIGGLAEATVQNPEAMKAAASKSAALAKGTARAAGILPYYEYVIITSDDLSGAFTEFRAWKNRKGLNIGLVTVSQIRSNYTGDDLSNNGNDDAGKIRKYLREGWLSGKTVYALLGGDASKVPIRMATAYDNTPYYQHPGNPINDGVIPTDTYYSSLNGNWNPDGDSWWGEPQDNPDIYPEILVGRLPCRTASDVANWTQTLLTYERSPGDGGNYLKKAAFVQADQFQEEFDAQTVAGPLNNSGFVTSIRQEEPTVYDPVPDPAAEPYLALNFLNQPVGIIGHFGHGGYNDFTVSWSGNGGEAKPDNSPDYLSMITTFSGTPNPAFYQAPMSFPDKTRPRIFFSSSCKPISPTDVFGNPAGGLGKSIGWGFMMSEKAGPAFVGHTNFGFPRASADMHASVLEKVLLGEFLTLAQGTDSQGGGMYDMMMLWKATLDPAGSSLTAEVSFSDMDGTGTTADHWNWRLTVLTETGEVELASASARYGLNRDTWTLAIPPLPSGKVPVRNAQGNPIYRVNVSTIDSDGSPHSSSMSLGHSAPAPALAKVQAAPVKVSSRVLGASIAVARGFFGGGHQHYLQMSYALAGDPEMPMWTEVPASFTAVSLSASADKRSLKVTTGTQGATICLKHTGASGGDYFSVVRFAGEYTFTNVDANDYPLFITITKDNFLPFMSQINSDLSMNGGVSKLDLVNSAVPFALRASTVGSSNKFDVAGSDGADRGYAFSLPSASVLDLSLCNSYTNFDAKLEVFRKNRTTTGIYNDDNSACAVKADYPLIKGAALPAGEYFAVVDGYNGLTGNFNFAASYSGQDGQRMPGFPFFTKNTTAGKGNNWDVFLTDGDDMAYEFTLSHAAHLEANACATTSGFDNKMEIFRKADRASTGFASDDYCGANAGLTNMHLPAGEYVLVMDGFNGTTGNFDLSMGYAADYTVTGLPYSHSGSTAGSVDDWDVAYGDGDDVAYKLVLTAPASLDITLCSPGTTYDSKLEVFRADGSSTGLYKDDSPLCPDNSQASILRGVSLEKGTHYIVVDGFNGVTGNYHLYVDNSVRVSKIAASPEQDGRQAFWAGLQEEQRKKGRIGPLAKAAGLKTDGADATALDPAKPLYELEKDANEGHPVVKPWEWSGSKELDLAALETYESAKLRRLEALARHPVEQLQLKGGVLQLRLQVVSSQEHVELELLEASGRRVWSQSQELGRGEHRLRYPVPQGLPKGTYFCRIQVGSLTFQKTLPWME